MPFYYVSILSMVPLGIAYLILALIFAGVVFVTRGIRWRGFVLAFVAIGFLFLPVSEEIWIAWHFAQACKQAGTFIKKKVQVAGYYDGTGRRAALASPDVDWPVRGYWAGLTYDAFYRELLPGITYVKLGAPCGMYAAAKGKSPPQLMLERTGGKDYSRIVKPNPDDFLKLDVPPDFYEATLDAALTANQRTRALIEHGKR